MYFIYDTKEKALEELQTRYKEAKIKMLLWQRASLKKRKTGEEFKRTFDGLNGCHLQKESWTSETHPHIEIIGYLGSCRIIDDVCAFWYCDELPKTDPRAVTHNKSCIRDTAIMSPDEIRQAIQDRANYWQDVVTDYERQLTIFDKAYDQYREAIAKADTELLNLTKNPKKELWQKASLYYIITETKY